ncbi:MAG: ABC transporter permease [Verrucomicrobia bacterium]|nr:ABC transporter permease [Verrucomicrobiota bacterium]
MQGQGVVGSAQGPWLFYALSVLGLSYSLIVGVRVTADCLSFEKRDGTLGLLFLTDLKGFDVVLGKLAATSLNSIYGLIALIPILAIPLQMGGVTGEDFFRMVLCLLNALFLSLSVGISVSALSYYDRKAMFAGFLTVMMIAAGPYAAMIYVETLDGPVSLGLRFFMWMFLIVSPITPFLMVNFIDVGGGILSPILLQVGLSEDMIFGVALIVSHSVAWLLLFVASRVLVSFVRQESHANWLVSLRAWAHQIIYGDESLRLAHRRKFLDLNAYSWLTSRERLKSKYMWIFIGSVISIYAWNLKSQGDVMFDDRTLVPLGFIVHAFIKVWIASEACYRVAEDRRIGALELLLSTPLGPWEMVKGQLLALWYQFGLPLIFLFVVELVLIFGFATEPRDQAGFQTRAMYLGAAFMLLFDCAMIGWVAMWNGVRYGSANRAIVQTVLFFLMVPWILFYLSLPLWEAIRLVLTTNGILVLDLRWLGFEFLRFDFLWDRIDSVGKVILWVVIGIVFDVKMGLGRARRMLILHFRDCVSGYQLDREKEKGN